MFIAQFSNSGATSAVFAGLNGANNNSLLAAVASLMAMPAATTCSFNALYVAGTITSGAVSDTLTITLMKNGSATALTTSITVSSLNATVTNSDTTPAHSFSVAPGDAVAIQLTQTSGAPTVRLSISTMCQ
jgi:hypothetical protein